MKLHITLDIDRIDQEAVKGEDFDQELETYLEEINIDGWEIKGIDIARIKQESSSLSHDFAKIIHSMASPITVEGTETKLEMESPSPMNQDYTVRQMLIFYADELLKRKGKQ